jgi:hypothetical protein
MDQKWSFWTKIDQNVDLADFKSDVFLFLTSRSDLRPFLDQKPILDRIWTEKPHFGAILDQKRPFWPLFDLFDFALIGFWRPQSR